MILAIAGTGDLLRRRLGLVDRDELAISVIAYAELMVGTVMGKAPGHALLSAFVELVPILPFDDRAAVAYASLPFRRARFDRLIAAHALSLGLTLVTNNEADFADIPGLRVENWAA